MATQVSDTGSKGRTRGSTDELALIAQRAQAFTNASGTAIALSEGNLEEIICRARSGSSAPEVGTALRVEGSFTGLCIQSGKELRCDDAETDTRVDTAAIRALGIRSMVVTPIKEENRVVGVLAVFAPTAHAFTITHVAVLKTMADQISILLQKERLAKEVGVQPEPARPVVPVASPKPVSAPSLPPPVVVKPATPAPAPRAAFPVVSKVEPIKTTAIAEDIVTPAALPKREEKRGEQRAEHRTGLATLDAAASEEKKSGVSLILIGVAAVAVIGIASTFAFLNMRKPAPPAAPAVQHVQETPNPATAQPAAPAPGTTASSAQPVTPAAPSSAPASKPTAGSSLAESPKKTDRTSARNSAPEVSVPERRAAETVALSAAPSKIASSNAESGQDAAPSLTLGGASGSGALSALAKSTAAPTPSMMTQSALEPVQVLKRVPPIYPLIAKQRRLSGVLEVQADVGKDGKVSNLQLLSGPTIFKDAAFDAIKQWQFRPAKLNGQPIDQSTKIRLQFNP